MKSNMVLCLTSMIIFLLSLIMNIASAKEFKVGDDFGWKQPGVNESSMYEDWAQKNHFQVGDTLDFEYKNDSLLMVDKWGYYHCDNNRTIIAYNYGKNIIKLDKPGPFYFISQSLEHCIKGQRLLVQVMSSQPIPDDSPVPAQAQAPAPTPTPAPAPSSAVLLSVKFTSLLFLIAPLAVAF